MTDTPHTSVQNLAPGTTTEARRPPSQDSMRFTTNHYVFYPVRADA